MPYLELIPKDSLTVVVRLKLTKGADCQLFYGTAFSEKNSLHFQATPDGAFHDYALTLPPQSPDSRIRLDFPPDCGDVVVASIKVLTQRAVTLPSNPDPVRPDPLPNGESAAVSRTPGGRRSGALSLPCG